MSCIVCMHSIGVVSVWWWWWWTNTYGVYFDLYTISVLVHERLEVQRGIAFASNTDIHFIRRVRPQIDASTTNARANARDRWCLVPRRLARIVMASHRGGESIALLGRRPRDRIEGEAQHHGDARADEEGGATWTREGTSDGERRSERDDEDARASAWDESPRAVSSERGAARPWRSLERSM